MRRGYRGAARLLWTPAVLGLMCAVAVVGIRGIGSVLSMQVIGAVVGRIGARPVALTGEVVLCLTLPWLACVSTRCFLSL